MKYIVQSTAVWDTIFLPGMWKPIEAPGGAGFYAMVGMKVWEDDVGLVTGVGEDYLLHFQEWYRNNALSTQGMLPKDPHSPRTVIRYALDGERTEEPVYGQEHYRKIGAVPEEIEPFCVNADGMYVFKSAEAVYWEKLFALKEKYGFKLMWEISADAAYADQFEHVKSIAEKTDIFSINATEARSLLQVETIVEAVQQFQQWTAPVIYLRLGSHGVRLIQGDRSIYVPSVPNISVKDTTGGGNSSSGGALIGFCRGCSLEEIGAMGNVSASFCIEQWGVPDLIDTALREEAERRKESVLALLEGKSNE